MKKIPLTQGQFAIVDDWWYDYLMQWKWYARWNPETHSYYAMRNEGKSPHRTSVMMSRVIMKTPKKMECDHKNHNTLDNREKNLRNVTTSQNQMNRRGAPKNNPLGVLGVVRSFMVLGRISILIKKRVGSQPGGLLKKPPKIEERQNLNIMKYPD